MVVLQSENWEAVYIDIHVSALGCVVHVPGSVGHHG